jgi:uracil-DNA glycosylase
MGLFDKIKQFESLEELNKAWENCNKCTLRIPEGRVSPSICKDENNIKVLVVGRSPTVPEAKLGKGMMTDPGGLEIRNWFTRLAHAWGIDPDQIAFSNIVHCPVTIRDPNRPDYRIDAKGNRIEPSITPTKECGKYLEQEIALMQPELIVSIGKDALLYFAQRKKTIPSVLKVSRGRVWKYRNAKFVSVVMPINTKDEERFEIAEDFHFLRTNFFGNERHLSINTKHDLVDIYKEFTTCSACDLCSYSKYRVFGTGWTRSPIVIVGEAPGEKEQQVGSPFVGPAGVFLWKKIVSRLTLPKDSVLSNQYGKVDPKRIYVTNAVKGWPGQGNPTPKTEEIMACSPFLQNQIKYVDPKVIICLGKTAAEAVTGLKKHMKTLRKNEHNCLFNESKVIVTWHPSYVMRRMQEQDTTPLEESVDDFERAIALI